MYNGWGPGGGSWNVRCASASKVRLITLSKGVFTWENLHWREFHIGMTYWFGIAFTWSWAIWYLGYLKVYILHVDKIHMRFRIANITHVLPVPGHRQIEFTPKRVVVSCSHETVARFRTGVKFSPRYNNRGDSRRHDILWWYHVNKCRAMTGNRSELAPARKSPRCHVNTP